MQERQACNRISWGAGYVAGAVGRGKGCRARQGRSSKAGAVGRGPLSPLAALIIIIPHFTALNTDRN